jgi:hypothetical protein
MTKRSRTLIPLVWAAIGVACGSEKVIVPEPRPPTITLAVTPSEVGMLQGESATIVATITRSSGFSGTVGLIVTGMPTGVAAVVTNVQTNGLVTTATVTFNASHSTDAGVYNLVVHGRGLGVTEATAAFALTVDPEPIFFDPGPEPIVPCPASGVCEQWAASATASSEYTENAWGAKQATGRPNAPVCEDDGRAWASLESNGVDWLELVYEESVRPTEIRVYEVFGASSIVKVEVKDAGGTYYTVYTAQPTSQPCSRVLIVPVTGISATIKVVRMSVDQRALNTWNEIDAVKLIGER